MLKTIKLAFGLMLLSCCLAQRCPRLKSIGNPVNYLHLFKEEGDTHFSFLNAKTEVDVVFQTFTSGDYKVAFKLTDTNYPPRVWLYLVWAKFNGDQIITDIVNYGRFRFLPADPTNADIASQTPNESLLKSFFQLASLPTLVSFSCNNKVIKMEYDYFTYMFANYYKTGLGLNQPLSI